jgi:hypothetical protein
VAGPLVALALAAAGCGDIGDPHRDGGPQLVSGADIARYPVHSPPRQLLEWWRAMQFQAAALARRYYARGSRPTELHLATQLSFGPDALGLQLKPHIAGTQRVGWSTTVFVVLTSEVRNPNGRVDRQRVPRAFTFVLENGTWKLADNHYVNRAVERARTQPRERRRPLAG